MSSQGASNPASPQQTLGFPENAELLIFEKFTTLNTKSLRPAIKDEEMAWCDGLMPIGINNLRTLYGVGPSIFNAPRGVPFAFFGFCNIGTTPYLIAMHTDGGVWAVNTNTAAATQIAPDGTVQSPSPLNTGLSQWSNQYLIIVSKQTNGYWLWDGTSFYGAGTVAPDIEMTSDGLNYTSQPTITLSTTGSGTGTAFSATLSNGGVSAIQVTNPGSGFANGDLAVLTITGGGSDDQASVTVTVDTSTGILTGVTVTNPGSGYPANSTVSLSGGGGSGGEIYIAAFGANGSITAIGIQNPGTGYTSAPSVAASGSGGSGFAATAIVSFGQIASASVASGGSGYLGNPTLTVLGDGQNAVLTPQVNSSGQLASVTVTNGGYGYTKALVQITGGNNAASANINLMPFGVSGTCAETYSTRVWVANGAVISFTSADSVSDFSTSNGGGSFTSKDSFLNIGFTALKNSNGFLYLIADSAINYISGVTTSGNPPTTTFQNQNVDPQIGTPYPGTVQVFSRNVMFGNSLGMYVSYGGAVTKISEPMDGIYNTVPSFGGALLSSAVANIFGIEVYLQLTPIIDSYTGQQVNKLLMWSGQKWWTSPQDINLTYIASQKINSVLTAWGTDGQGIYPLFQQPSTAFQKVAQSKLFSREHYLYTKVARNLYGMLNFYAVDDEPVNFTVDNETNSSSYEVTAASTGFVWVNNADQPFIWTNNASQPFLWSRGGSAGLSIFGPIAVGQSGRTIGMTMLTNAGDVALISATVMDQLYTANT